MDDGRSAVRIATGERAPRETELRLFAKADLEAAATAWLASTMFRKLHENRKPGFDVQGHDFERVKQHLFEELDAAAAAFRRTDGELRREEERRAGPSELPDAQPLVYAIDAAFRQGVTPATINDIAGNIAGTATLALLDKHGLEWMLRFLAQIGCDIETGVVMTASAREDVRASAAQRFVLRSMFAAVEGDTNSTDRRLAAFLDGRFDIGDPAALDELTAWKAIGQLRERITAYLDRAA